MSEQHFIQSVYLVMTLLGIEPSKMRPNYEHESGSGRVLVGVPDSKVALSTEGDTYEPFEEDGWFVVPIPASHLQTLSIAFTQLQSLSFEHVRRQNIANKSSSSHEEVLLSAIIKKGLPNPDRNYRLEREDGKELTTPDFTWPRYKIAFFVDGLWWHVAKDDVNTLDILQDTNNRKALLESNKTRNEKDGEIRSKMQVDGWTVLSCTDRQLEDHANIEEQVQRISDTIQRIRREQKVLEESTQSHEHTVSIDDLL